MKIALQSGQGGAQLKMLWQLYMDNFACGRAVVDPEKISRGG